MEILIGSWIFCTVVCSLLSVWTTHASMLSKSRNMLIASHLAEQLMEQCISQGWDVVPIPASPSTQFREVFTINGQSYTVIFQYSIEVKTNPPPQPPGPDKPPVGTKNILVTVSWNDSQTQVKQVQMETRVYWPG